MFTENSSKLIFDVHPIQIVGDATFSNLCCRSYSCINVLKIKYVRYACISLYQLCLMSGFTVVKHKKYGN